MAAAYPPARQGDAHLTRLLLVDDEPDILESLQHLIEATLDVEVRTATSGQEALEMVAREEFAVVVSDYRMPGMDGLELLTRLNGVQPAMARVMVTAFADQTLIARAHEQAQISRFLSKPLDSAEVVRVLRDLLRPLEGQQPSRPTAAGSPTPRPASRPAPPDLEDLRALLDPIAEIEGTRSAFLLHAGGDLLVWRGAAPADPVSAPVLAALHASADAAARALGRTQVSRTTLDLGSTTLQITPLERDLLLVVESDPGAPVEAIHTAAARAGRILHEILVRT